MFSDDCVDWALEMIELGFDTENLLILASFVKPINYFEAINYLSVAIDELGLQLKMGDEGIISYSSYYINQIAQSINVRKNLCKVSEFAQQVDYPSSIYDFYSLYWAWDELENIGLQWYWKDEITLNEIEETVVKIASQWMEDNRLSYQQILYSDGKFQ